MKMFEDNGQKAQKSQGHNDVILGIWLNTQKKIDYNKERNC